MKANVKIARATQSLLFTLLTVGSLVLNSSLALASGELRIKECRYDVHGVEISDIRNDGYFQNTLPMGKVSADHYRGSVSLMSGYRLTIDAVLRNHKIALKSTVESPSRVALSSRGVADLPMSSSSYRLKSLNQKASELMNGDESEAQGTTFYRAEVTCVVGPTTLSDRLFDMVEER